MIDFDFNKNCYGCSACKNICPKSAITMTENKEGFLMPDIDKKKCINCGLCDKVCPHLNKINKVKENSDEVYFLYRKNKKDLQIKSTSTGLAYELGKSVILDGGYVCGCIWDENIEAKHIISNDIDILEKMRGSKYVQSDIQNVYIEIKDILNTGKKIMFFGTACQIEGIKKYLNKDYNNLITVQIICHSVSSPGILRRYIESVEKSTGKKITDINFRYKEKGGWLTPNSVYYLSDGSKMKNISYINDAYFVGFGKGLFDRNSCGNCEFKANYDIADIIIGDAWGISGKSLKKSKNHGASVVLINSGNGHKELENVKDLFEMEKIDLNTAVNGNPAIVKSYKANPKRDKFINKILNNETKEFPNESIIGSKSKFKVLLFNIGILSILKNIAYKLKHR